MLRTCVLALALAATAAAETRVTVVPINEEIGSSTVYLVKRSLEQAKRDHSSFVLFEINTPGGRVDSSLEICDLIDQCGIPTAAWVRGGNFGGAQSGGALISIACGRIVMDPVATIGSAHPVDSNGVMSNEKIVSWVAAQFRAWAEKKKLPPLVAAGMVDPDLEIREISVDGQKRLVDGEEAARLEKEGVKVHLLREVKARGKLLNLTASEARDLGLAAEQADSEERALALLGEKPSVIVRISHSWSDDAVGVLNNGLVTAILIALGFIFVWIEMKTPGIGIPALISATCFGLVFFSHYLIGLSGGLEIAIFGLGAALLFVELITPGFGLVGISGILLIFASLVLAMQGFIFPSNPYQWNSLTGNFLLLTTSMGFAVVGFASIVRFLPKTPMFQRLILNAELAAGESHPAAVLLGRMGTALTPLRPAGKATIEGMEVDVVAEGAFVEKDQQIAVIRVDGPSVVVRRA